MAQSPLARVFRPPILVRSLWVAVTVGTILNLINQGDALLGGGPVNWFKIVLTYCVPFLVASYGAWSAFAASHGNSSPD